MSMTIEEFHREAVRLAKRPDDLMGLTDSAWKACDRGMANRAVFKPGPVLEVCRWALHLEERLRKAEATESDP